MGCGRIEGRTRTRGDRCSSTGHGKQQEEMCRAAALQVSRVSSESCHMPAAPARDTARGRHPCEDKHRSWDKRKGPQGRQRIHCLQHHRPKSDCTGLQKQDHTRGVQRCYVCTKICVCTGRSRKQYLFNTTFLRESKVRFKSPKPHFCNTASKTHRAQGRAPPHPQKILQVSQLTSARTPLSQPPSRQSSSRTLPLVWAVLTLCSVVMKSLSQGLLLPWHSQ